MFTFFLMVKYSTKKRIFIYFTYAMVTTHEKRDFTKKNSKKNWSNIKNKQFNSMIKTNTIFKIFFLLFLDYYVKMFYFSFTIG